MIVQRHGGVTNRPGTNFIVETKNSAVKSRLIEFIFNSGQTYILEFGNQYIRFISNGGQINVSGVAAWSGAVNYLIGDLVLQGGIYYYAIASSLAQAPPNAAFWYPLTGTVYEIPTPYVTADIPDLQFVQVADVMTLVHPNYAPRELRRLGHTDWVLAQISFVPTIQAPSAVNAPTGAAGSRNVGYAITAVALDTGDESLPTFSSVLGAACTQASPVDVTWNASAGAQAYNIYRAIFPTFPFPPGFVPSYLFIGSSLGTAYRDEGVIGDVLDTAPSLRVIFDAVNKYPSVVGFFQQRRGFANSNNAPETTWLSQVGHFSNFNVSFPIKDDDAITFTLAGRRVNAVRHLIDAGKLVLFTSEGVWLVADETQLITPATLQLTQKSYYGANKVPPVVVGNIPIYVEARGSMVLDYKDDQMQGYQGKDLTIFASHLFDGLTLTDLAYQRNPNSVIWGIRSDGCLLGLTYLPEQDVWGWHRHDTDGVFEDIASIPEGLEDKIYVIVKRTINGATKRYIEEFSNRYFNDIRDINILDAALSYDGRNTGATTMTLTGGVTWSSDEDLTLTSSVAFFAGGDVGNTIVLQEISAAGKVLDTIRLVISAFTDNQHVTVNSSKIVPANLRNSARTTWSKAVKNFAGLGHLEGKNVAIISDGFVKASPNNAAYSLAPVVGGAVSIDVAGSVVRIGLPFLSDVELLDLDSPSGQSRKSERSLVNRVLYSVEKTRGVWIGMDAPTDDSVDPLEGLSETQPSSTEDADSPPPLITDTLEVGIESNYNNSGRIFFRQVDPLPFTLLAAIPGGYL